MRWSPSHRSYICLTNHTSAFRNPNGAFVHLLEASSGENRASCLMWSPNRASKGVSISQALGVGICASTDWARAFLHISSLVSDVYEFPLSKRFIWERKRVCKCGGGAEGENPEQTPHWVGEPHVGLDPMTPRSWPELKPRVGCSTDWATQVPLWVPFV